MTEAAQPVIVFDVSPIGSVVTVCAACAEVRSYDVYDGASPLAKLELENAQLRAVLAIARSAVEWFCSNSTRSDSAAIKAVTAVLEEEERCPRVGMLDFCDKIRAAMATKL